MTRRSIEGNARRGKGVTGGRRRPGKGDTSDALALVVVCGDYMTRRGLLRDVLGRGRRRQCFLCIHWAILRGGEGVAHACRVVRAQRVASRPLGARSLQERCA